jgi:hypothetical protein
MPRKRALPEDAEIAISGRIEPVLVNGGATIKSMSAAFMADVERAWRKHGPKILDTLAEKYPQAFFGGMVAMTKDRALGSAHMYVYFYEPLRSTIIVARGISAGRRRRKRCQKVSP